MVGLENPLCPQRASLEGCFCGTSQRERKSEPHFDVVCFLIVFSYQLTPSMEVVCPSGQKNIYPDSQGQMADFLGVLISLIEDISRGGQALKVGQDNNLGKTIMERDGIS